LSFEIWIFRNGQPDHVPYAICDLQTHFSFDKQIQIK